MESSLQKLYIPLVQKPYCGAVTCLQMIIQRRLGELFDQQYLAQYFDVKVDEKTLDAFNVKLKTLTSHAHDEGMKTTESEDIINKFFIDHRLPLVAKAFPYSSIKNLEQFIHGHLLSNDDLRVEYKLHNIYNSNSIHDGLIESANHVKVTMINPSPLRPPRFDLGMGLLGQALSDEFARETGIIAVKHIPNLLKMDVYELYKEGRISKSLLDIMRDIRVYSLGKLISSLSKYEFSKIRITVRKDIEEIERVLRECGCEGLRK